MSRLRFMDQTVEYGSTIRDLRPRYEFPVFALDVIVDFFDNRLYEVLPVGLAHCLIEIHGVRIGPGEERNRIGHLVLENIIVLVHGLVIRLIRGFDKTFWSFNGTCARAREARQQWRYLTLRRFLCWRRCRYMDLVWISRTIIGRFEKYIVGIRLWSRLRLRSLASSLGNLHDFASIGVKASNLLPL